MRILLISRHHPFPPTSGASQRSAIIWHALSECAEADLLIVSDQLGQPESVNSECKPIGFIQIQLEDNQPHSRFARICPPGAKLFQACSANYGFQPSPRIVAQVREIISKKKYDIIVARYLTTFSQCGLAGSRRVIVDIDDLPSQTFQTMVVDKEKRYVFKLLRQFQRRRIVLHTRFLVNQCHHVWLPNEVQVPEFTNASWLPNIPYPFFDKPVGKEPWNDVKSKIVLFVGLMNYEPNLEAMRFFVEHVWPNVIRDIPETKLRIVGGGLPPHWKAAWERVPGVQALGYVENLTPEYRGSTMTVVPMFSGGGTNIKVVEAMSYARPCLLSAVAAKGFKGIVRDGETAFIASTPEEFIRKTKILLNDSELCRNVGIAGYHAIQESYSYEAVCREVVRTIKTA